MYVDSTNVTVGSTLPGGHIYSAATCSYIPRYIATLITAIIAQIPRLMLRRGWTDLYSQNVTQNELSVFLGGGGRDVSKFNNIANALEKYIESKVSYTASTLDR